MTASKNNKSICDFSILRDLRKQNKMNIARCSELSGVSPSVISKLERNQNNAEIDTLYRLAKVFGITLSDLISLAENQSSHLVQSSHYQYSGFQFERILYSNLRCMHAKAKKGSQISKPEIHRDDYELCWVLSGKIQISLPNEKHTLEPGAAIQFDALLSHTYEVLSDAELILIHLKKGKRF
ncbi:MAG: XRE family transcriptional regulator [Lentisphaeria bacterium]